ncbi:PIN domain-containing protein [Candidatus Woesearchaeota archaeon]|jgi:rRNA-processing protein FCF1|nr:PIN domain-containing protein [Candidatus Woesearchaeota archaeon]MBT7062558.1 PIN domain-containing protein [Candidatus Woesearchaeota archaeon]
MKVIIDTNALIYAAKKKQDLATVIDRQILIPNLVIAELEKLTKTARKGADKAAAKLALQLIKHKKWKIIKLEAGHTDKMILKYAKEHSCDIYTFDKLLKAEHKL